MFKERALTDTGFVKGSGKTFTMGGGSLLNQTDDDVGIMPRAVQQVFEVITANANREYSVRVSYVEIYKEELFDLLDLDNVSKDLHIREDDKGNTGIGSSVWHEFIIISILFVHLSIELILVVGLQLQWLIGSVIWEIYYVWMVVLMWL